MAHKVYGLKDIDETATLSQYLPTIFVVSKEYEKDVLVYAKKHSMKLLDGRLIVAENDLANCPDSKVWFNKKKDTILRKKVTPVRFTSEMLDELNMRSKFEFGKSLSDRWIKGKLLGIAKLSYLKKIRGLT